MRFFQVLLILFTLTHAVQAQNDTLMWRDLQQDWRMKSADGIVPMVEADEFEGNLLFIPVPLDADGDALLFIHSPKQVTFFHNKELVTLIHGKRWMRVDSLARMYGDSVVYTIYSKDLVPSAIRTRIYRLRDGTTTSKEPVSIIGRVDGGERDVWTLSFFLMLLYLAVLFYFYPRNVREFFWITRAISFRELDENLIKTRPMSLVNISFYLLLALMMAWVACVLFTLSGSTWGNTWFGYDGFWEGMWVWLRMGAGLFILLILKFALIWIFKELYRISDFINSHYFNYIRMGLLFYGLITLVLFVSIFTLFVADTHTYEIIGYVLLGLLGIRVLILYFKLMNSSSHTILHLFSYLCATELIPLLMVISVGFNQMM